MVPAQENLTATGTGLITDRPGTDAQSSESGQPVHFIPHPAEEVSTRTPQRAFPTEYKEAEKHRKQVAKN